MQSIGSRPLQRLMPYSNAPLLTGMRIYIYVMPFTYALSMANGLLTMSLLMSACLAVQLALRQLRHIVIIPRLTTSFFLFLAFLALLPLAQLFTGTVSSKSLNHFFAYTGSIFAFGLIPMLAVANISRPGWANVLLRDMMWTARITALVAVVQFISSNFLGIFWEDLIYYPDSIEAKSTFLGVFFRSRGFASEPGHFAFTLELLAPLLMYGHSVSQKRLKFIMIMDFLLLLLAFLCTGSPAGLLIFGTGFLLAALLFPSRHVVPFLLSFLVALVMTLGLASVIGNQFDQSNPVDLISSIFIDKLDSTSSADRAERIRIGLDLIGNASPLHFLLGYGPAVYASQNLGEDGTIIQFYLLLLLEGGAIGTLFFLGGFVFMAALAVKELGKDRVFFFWAFLSLAIHYLFISNYYYPMIWFMFPLLLIMRAVHEKG